MFHSLGKIVSSRPPLWLLGWVVVAVALGVFAPRVEDVVTEGEFTFLPDSEPSRRAEELYLRAFPNDLFGSTVVLVVRRNNYSNDKLLDEDRAFIENVLKPRLERIQPVMDLASAYTQLSDEIDDPAVVAEDINGSLRGLPHAVATGAVRDWHADVFRAATDPDPDTTVATPLDARVLRELHRQRVAVATLDPAWHQRLDAAGTPDAGRWVLSEADVAEVEQPDPIIADVRTFTDQSIGHMLDSADDKATLVVVQLTTDFLERSNKPAIARIERLVAETDEGPARLMDDMPPGLELAMSGSATVGRDMRAAAELSARTIDWVTIVLVLILLLAIYRAPILAIIPLITVGLAAHVALRSLAYLADLGVVDLFSSAKIYVTVVLYGAGVDYCMFLMARYKEELDEGATLREAMAHSVNRVGAALAASAGTTIVGIGMMGFAEFGKFQQAGLSMAFSLVFVLLAALTFTPALLLLAGRWAFWPHIRNERVQTGMGWFSPTTLVARLMEQDLVGKAWRQIGKALVARPGTILLASVLLMMPFAVIGVLFFENRSYALLSDLPQDEPAVVGARVVQEHFPAGQAGPLTVLIQNDDVDFRKFSDEYAPIAGREAIQQLVNRLYERRDELGIADIRSVVHPFGMTEAGRNAYAARQRKGLAVVRKKADDYYVSSQPGLDGNVARLDVDFDFDPFQRESIERFEKFREAAAAELPAELGEPVQEFSSTDEQTRLLYMGTTPSIRDLKAVTGRDQIRIDILVILGVFAVLVLLLRRVAISAYLIVSVFFSYLVTLGVTFAVFWLLDPSGFGGLDWKVPVFLFTILIAVGEDYNIYLVTRIDEEQQRHGAIPGISVALAKTGKIISSCGLIMAGTFAALLSAKLVGMQQLGFALAFGVLLDTFVVRPILVPAWLILLNTGRLGALGRLLGAQDGPAVAPVRISPETELQERRAG